MPLTADAGHALDLAIDRDLDQGAEAIVIVTEAVMPAPRSLEVRPARLDHGHVAIDRASAASMVTLPMLIGS